MPESEESAIEVINITRLKTDKFLRFLTSKGYVIS